MQVDFLSKTFKNEFKKNIQNRGRTIQKLEKKIIYSLSVLCSPRLSLTRSPQISDQNKSEAREQEGLVEITYGIAASSFFKRAGNSN